MRYVLGVGEGGVSVIDSRPTGGTADVDVPASAPRLAPVRALRSAMPSTATTATPSDAGTATTATPSDASTATDTATNTGTTAASTAASSSVTATDTAGSLPLRRAHREAHREAQREARPTFGAALSREASQALRRAIGA